MLTRIISSLDRKKLLSLFLAVALLFSALPLNGSWAGLGLKANAVETTGYCGADVTWSFNQSTWYTHN